MKKKNLKGLSLFLLAFISFFATINIVGAVPTAAFFYDYEVHVKLPDNLVVGQNDVILTAHSANSNVRIENLEISYKITEIDKATYDTFKAVQDRIDLKVKTSQKLTSSDTDIKAYNDLINKTYAKNDYWCYRGFKTGKITLEDFCGKKYFIVTADVADKNTAQGAGQYTWEYQIARVYEVTGTKIDCDKVPNNPKTGVTSPYVICGVVAATAITIFVISKKKKYI